MVENNIVKGNQPSVCVGLGGKKLNVSVFVCYGMLVLVCFTDLTLGSKTASDESQMCKVTLGGWGRCGWPGSSKSWLQSRLLPPLLHQRPGEETGPDPSKWQP